MDEETWAELFLSGGALPPLVLLFGLLASQELQFWPLDEGDFRGDLKGLPPCVAPFLEDLADPECCICLTPLAGIVPTPLYARLKAISDRAADTVAQFLDEGLRRAACGHAFHARCLESWARSSQIRGAAVCPLCRGPLSEETYEPYLTTARS